MNRRAEAPTGISLWVAGARPRTLGAAVAPVLVGSAAGALAGGGLLLGRAALALLVALALQVGANYANDYSDGVRGTDAERVGPLRLTARGLVPAGAVRAAAVLAFAVAALAGTVLSLVAEPWLLLLGVAAIAAAVLYTGGPRPYGYLGLGEVMVLAFFGFAATLGSAYVQHPTVTSTGTLAATAMGLVACSLLLANNVRDREQDALAGKRTLAVRLGDRRARALYAAGLAGAFIAVVALGFLHPWVLLGLATLPVAIPPVRLVLSGARGPHLIPALAGTVRIEMVLAVLLVLALWWS